MNDEERIKECQKEIRRLRACVREYEEQLENIRNGNCDFVVSEQIFSPQNYLMTVTGKCFVVDGDNDILTIKNILKQEGHEKLKCFSLSELLQAVSEKCNVVLVDCMVCEEKEFTHRLCWFEVKKTKNDRRYVNDTEK